MVTRQAKTYQNILSCRIGLEGVMIDINNAAVKSRVLFSEVIENWTMTATEKNQLRMQKVQQLPKKKVYIYTYIN